MNKDDSERLARTLVEGGHVPVSHPDRASLVILNGCSVRDNSDRKVWGRVGALRAERRKRPGLLVALTGCTAKATREEIEPYSDALDVVFSARDAKPLLELLEDRPGPVLEDWEEYHPDALPGSGEVCRFVTVIHGCSKGCTYCIVPFRRGPEVSREPEEILVEASQKVAEGAKEITFLGQIVNRYGRDLPGRPGLTGLLRMAHERAVAPRLRFLTAHPRHLDAELARTMGELPSVCEEINLPVQSGDDEVLKRMARGYDTDFYRSRIDLLREHVAGVAISTDVIVGFPGESREQFGRTLRLLEEIRFDVVHVAAFSPRGGTVAAAWGDDVPAVEKLARLHEVEDLQAEIAAGINRQLIGSRQEVLFEELRDGPAPGTGPRWMGRTRTNKLVFCEAESKIEAGEIREVEIVGATPWSLRGQVVSREQAG